MTITFKGIELVEEGNLFISLEKEDYDIFVPEIDRPDREIWQGQYATGSA